MMARVSSAVALFTVPILLLATIQCDNAVRMKTTLSSLGSAIKTIRFVMSMYCLIFSWRIYSVLRPFASGLPPTTNVIPMALKLNAASKNRLSKYDTCVCKRHHCCSKALCSLATTDATHYRRPTTDYTNENNNHYENPEHVLVFHYLIDNTRVR